MKEYDSCSSNQQVVFNNILRSARNPVECAFGRLKARWGILTRNMDLKLELVPIVAYSCFVLHNFCEKYKSYLSDELLKVQREHVEQSQELYRNIPDPTYSIDEGEGDIVRKTLTAYVKDCICQ